MSHDGSQPLIPYTRHSVDDSDVAAVAAVLSGNALTQGPLAPAFAQAVAKFCGAKFGVAVSSGTAALHIAALAAGLVPSKRLWTSPNSFVASANCGLYCGADVDFVDIDIETGNMSIAALAEKLVRAAAEDRLPDVVIPVHFAGEPCDLTALEKLKRRYGFVVIEDAAHALGARYRNMPVGGNGVGEMTIMSFHPTKNITSAEGGVVLTNDAALYRRLGVFSVHGITHEPAEMIGASDGPWYYEQLEIGFNYRLSDVHAALGLSQIKRLDTFVSRRAELAARYDDAFSGSPLLQPLKRDSANRSGHHLYVVHLAGPLRDRLFAELLAQGIRCQVHYIPIHLQPVYRRFGFKPGDFPEAERHYREALSLPLYPDLTANQQNRVINAIRQVVDARS